MCPWLLAAIAAFGTEDQKPQEVQEKVVVSRVVITGHVIDKFANPITSLGINDFRLVVDGQDTPIESVEWVPQTKVSEEVPMAISPTEPVQPEKPVPATVFRRLTVLLFQWEIAGQKDVGFVRMMREAERLVDSADPHDWFAVFGFGSSLRLIHDFTTNHESVKNAILKIRNTGWRGVRQETDGPTLAAQADACGRSDSIEAALE